MLRRWNHSLGLSLVSALLLFSLILPAGVFLLAYLGFPPVIGNLASAHALKDYAAQVYPAWEAQGSWASFNLTDGYHLSFSCGEETHSLGYAWSSGLVIDKEREEALLAEREVAQAIRANGLWRPGHMTTFCSVRWSPHAPETPCVSLRSDLYGDGYLEEEDLRERLADAGMALSQALAPLLPIHTLSVQYGYIPEGENIYSWCSIAIELEDGVPLTREALLSAPLQVQSPL